MRLAVCSRAALAALALASPLAAQSAATSPADPHRTVFSIQPLPAIGYEYGRPAAWNGIRRSLITPRVGIGISC